MFILEHTIVIISIKIYAIITILNYHHDLITISDKDPVFYS